MLKSNSPSFSKLRAVLKEDGQTAVRAILSILVTDVVNFLSVGKTMNADQVMKTVDLILEDYSHLKPDDFKLCFTRAKKGYFGKSYDRIDGMVIFEWLQQYEFEKSDEIEHYREKENHLFKKQASELPTEKEVEGGVAMPEWFKESMKKMFEKTVKPEEKIARKSNPVNDMVQTWIQRFREILLQQDDGNSSRFIKKYGRHMDINEYLQFKQSQYNRIVEYHEKV
ncbi:MAG: hypothetical protein J7577_01000 [Sphingobacteriaceae bacterium]|nr:hypothetical protein [Sphingobacteriaceae bacterium]